MLGGLVRDYKYKVSKKSYWAGTEDFCGKKLSGIDMAVKTLTLIKTVLLKFTSNI